MTKCVCRVSARVCSAFWALGINLVCLYLVANSVAFASQEEQKDCSDLVLMNVGNSVGVDPIVDAYLERHTLQELIAADKEQNLAYQHPMMLMDAFQRVFSWTQFIKPKEIVSPYYTREPMTLFPIFSHILPVNDGRIIVGQYEQIQALVEYIERGAAGDGSTSKMPLFVGPPGTAKTELLITLLNVAEHLLLNHPSYYQYTYQWKDLHQHKALHPFLHQLEADGHSPMPCPLDHSPFALLPKSYQKALLTMANERVQEIIGYDARPFGLMCPHCHHVRQKLIESWSQKNNKQLPTDKQIVENILAPHLEIMRIYLSDAAGNKPMVNSEGQDVDYPGLFGQVNPFVFTELGAAHPFSYHLNGKVRGKAGLLLLNEFFRNPAELRNVFLEVIENKVVARGGMPSIFLDAVIIAADNWESIDKAKEDGAGAQMDRAEVHHMLYDAHPAIIEKTALHMKMANKAKWFMQKLPEPGTSGGLDSAIEEIDVPEEQVVPALLDKMYPDPDGNGVMRTHLYRYKLWVQVRGQKLVHISPHALAYMADILAASRLVTDEASVQKLNQNFNVASSNEFRDVIQRLRILRGEEPLQAGIGEELEELTSLLMEGNEGVSMRDAANTWLTTAISKAALDGDGGAVTPLLMRKVFQRLLTQKGKLKYTDNNQRIYWLNLMELIAQDRLLPMIQQDLNTAMGQGTGMVDALYDEVWREIQAVAQGNDKFSPKGGGSARNVNRKRLEQIARIYRLVNRRDIDYQSVIAQTAAPMGETSRRHEGLVRAISRYLSDMEKDRVKFTFAKVASQGEGSAEERVKYQDMVHILINQLGYCERSIKDAIDLGEQLETQFKQATGQN